MASVLKIGKSVWFKTNSAELDYQWCTFSGTTEGWPIYTSTLQLLSIATDNEKEYIGKSYSESGISTEGDLILMRILTFFGIAENTFLGKLFKSLFNDISKAFALFILVLVVYFLFLFGFFKTHR